MEQLILFFQWTTSLFKNFWLQHISKRGYWMIDEVPSSYLKIIDLGSSWNLEWHGAENKGKAGFMTILYYICITGAITPRARPYFETQCFWFVRNLMCFCKWRFYGHSHVESEWERAIFKQTREGDLLVSDFSNWGVADIANLLLLSLNDSSTTWQTARQHATRLGQMI